MIGNPVDYDKKFKNSNFPIFPPKFDSELKRYMHLLSGKNVLDLGIGQGRNSIPLANSGFNVTGVDYSTKCLDICKNNCNELNLVQSDIRTFLIEKNKYDLILSRCVLHFLHKKDSYQIINNIKTNIKNNGLVYIHVFSIEDPRYKKHANSPNVEVLDNNILHNIINDTYVCFFTKEEILDLFSDFKTIYISQEYLLEQKEDSSQYAGIIKYIGQKI